ncbi:MAG TPA: lysophospholipase [Anaerolineaceae bacterium]|nr:lysophospholipase [Anaerolineaceae bacterium]HPN50180.1 lysophospholipase [Anaerolineaceae bacterium]
MKYDTFTLKATDQITLFGQCWQPENGTKAVVCLIHGLGEHCNRYPHLAKAFNNAGFAVFTGDLRGHGQSEGSRGYIPSYAQVMDDITTFMDAARARFPGLPVFLYGHSMGGNFVINYGLQRKPAIKGLIASGPALKTAEVPAPKKLIADLLNALAPSLSMDNGLELDALSHVPEVISKYQQDPLVHKKISARLGVSLLKQGEWAIEHAAEFPAAIPLLVMHGASDRICLPEGSKLFTAKVKGDVTLKLWEGSYHEIHNEANQEEVFAYAIAWMEQRLKSA